MLRLLVVVSEQCVCVFCSGGFVESLPFWRPPNSSFFSFQDFSMVSFWWLKIPCLIGNSAGCVADYVICVWCVCVCVCVAIKRSTWVRWECPHKDIRKEKTIVCLFKGNSYRKYQNVIKHASYLETD